MLKLLSASSENNKTSFLRLMFTALAAAFGVQSRKNHEADFTQKSVIPYIVAGVLFTALFVFSLIAIVSFVI